MLTRLGMLWPSSQPAIHTFRTNRGGGGIIIIADDMIPHMDGSTLEWWDGGANHNNKCANCNPVQPSIRPFIHPSAYTLVSVVVGWVQNIILQADGLNIEMYI